MWNENCMLQVSLLVRRELIERARDFNIILDDVSITELSFGKEYTAAVESKQVGTRFSIIMTIFMLNPYRGLLNQIFLKDSYTLSSLRWPHSLKLWNHCYFMFLWLALTFQLSYILIWFLTPELSWQWGASWTLGTCMLGLCSDTGWVLTAHISVTSL